MILLDTDVISALMKPKIPPQVVKWLAQYETGKVHISAISRAEIEEGVYRMPEGGRKREMSARAEKIFQEYATRCLSFNAGSAHFYAIARNAGKTTRQPTAIADMMIAAITMQNRLILATRNLRDFADIGTLETVNPWD